ncbi:Uma2 family endonuclease [Anabaena cylindrica UHCC 0172]|uniref:Uma2 family endonuclease n=1 Tax=Anabaena cylindrica TaxID=1165 RepID=UPI002B215D60|nr:Uma2 family endonuclease [Anabaena cylindrica]MEA5549913.1 Uma2 family endonuclease [Anabaena cylindrica UHCC 0172]
MSETLADIAIPPQFPDHTQLPESDGEFVFAERAEGNNFQEHPQSIIITDSIIQTLQKLHPDGLFCIGQDCGIYWRETEPPEKGTVAPDWFYIPDIAPQLSGKIRRSYVLWREYIPPLIAIELASGNGDEERDTTPLSGLKEGEKPGKFWVYERIIRIPYYAIYEVNNDKLEVYHLVDFSYQKMQPNERGHYPIPPLGVELGLWQGSYLNNPEQLWLRWWDLDGNLLLVGKEEAQLQRLRAEQAELKAAKLAAHMREMGIDPDDDL